MLEKMTKVTQFRTLNENLDLDKNLRHASLEKNH